MWPRTCAAPPLYKCVPPPAAEPRSFVLPGSRPDAAADQRASRKSRLVFPTVEGCRTDAPDMAPRRCSSTDYTAGGSKATRMISETCTKIQKLEN